MRNFNACLAFFIATYLFCSLAVAGKVTYIYSDPSGTPLAEADAQGNITATFDYRPFGALALGMPVSEPGFTGHVNDADTALVYMQARYYDPVTGRFLSVDPVDVKIDLFSFNRFDYGRNNPIVNIDPDGREPCNSCDDIVGISAFSGRQLRASGVLRSDYTAKAAMLDAADGAGRSALKAETRANTPSMVQKTIEAVRPSTAQVSGSGGRANVSNPKINAAGEGLKVAGNTLLVATVAMSAYDVATSPQPTRALAGAGGATLGGIGGGEGGAWMGAGVGFFIAGPPGAAVGAIVGGIGGSAVGAHYGSKAAGAVYDKVNN